MIDLDRVTRLPTGFAGKGKPKVGDRTYKRPVDCAVRHKRGVIH